MHDAAHDAAGVPTLDPGLTLLERPDAHSPALHRLVVAELSRHDGSTLWIDTGRDASSYRLHDHAGPRTSVAHLQIARAFTAHQHHCLIERAVERVTSRTRFVVVPCTAALYQDEDLHDQFGRDLLESSVVHLRELADALEIPVLLTTADAATASGELLAYHADTIIRSETTDMGVRFHGGDFETTAYLQDGYWQTTIPYWVDLFGCICDGDQMDVPDQPAAPSLRG